ncbi:unnamed protein product [Porites lobata]|uniref:ZP domain-containing protein n=1 Tax=Porites lobata TaxID=104759 RepID=A0ABN8PJF6_9CNID|nr:unnamed protein product [Porites lobata]
MPFSFLTANGATVRCGENVMAITLPKSLLLGLNREHLTLRDENCVATETSTHFTLKTTLTGCGTIARYRGKATVYSNTVMAIPVAGDAIITRVREIKIPFRCYYKNSGQAFAVGVEPDARKLVFNEDGKGNFTVALDMFPDERFSSAYTLKDYPVEVKLRQNLYFQASVKTKDKTLSVLAENCYSTPSKNRNHNDRYYLIKDGCPVDKTTAVVKSIKASMARFTTEAFKFIADHPFVFVHCEIRICDARNSNSRCAQGCITEIRERRDVRNDDVLYPLAQGPLTISSDMTLNLSSARKSALQACVLQAWKGWYCSRCLCNGGNIFALHCGNGMATKQKIPLSHCPHSEGYMLLLHFISKSHVYILLQLDILQSFGDI